MRNKRNESVHKVAKAVHISGNYLSEIERGLKEPSDVVLDSLADYYECDKAELFSLYGRIPPEETNLLLKNPPFRKILTQLSLDDRLTDDEKDKLSTEFHKLYTSFIKGKE
ncbi:hypothetical protein SDC9_190117 [bioreactor metagenome]|uniref:HTH cro/C1-type domain-containing protein n=1 Tax=bioreactor metagenome TaxID=1076179 RepID=A0A645HUM5_9ZZZZ